MKHKVYINRMFIQIFLMIVALACIFPLLWMISTSLKTRSEVYTNPSLIPQGFHLDNYIKAWVYAKMSVYFSNTVLYTVVIVFGVVAVATLASYAFARLKFPLKNTLYLSFIATIMIPIPGSFIPIYVLLVKLGIQNTRIGYILPMINAGLATAIFILRAFFEGIPKELEDSAVIDGCGKFKIYLRIVIPLSIPAISTIIIFNALGAWNEYLLPSVVFSDINLMPIQQGLFVFRGQYFTQYELLMAGTVISTIPIILLYLALNRQVLNGITSGAIKE